MQTLHGAYEVRGADVVAMLPGGEAWLRAVNEAPEQERHIAVHEGHLLHLNAADRAAWYAGAHALLADFTVSGTAAQVRAKAEAFAGQGVTELVYQPVGDIRRELETLASALDGIVSTHGP